MNLSPPNIPQLEEKTVQNSQQQLADLRRRSTKITPLKLRRTNPSRPTTVESLCDWDSDKVTPLKLYRGVQRIKSDQSSLNLLLLFRALCHEGRNSP